MPLRGLSSSADTARLGKPTMRPSTCGGSSPSGTTCGVADWCSRRLRGSTGGWQSGGGRGQTPHWKSLLINFVVEQTGYPPEVVELDADLEADLGIDSIKKAQLFGELREYFDVTPGENLTLDDFPTLRHVLEFLRARNQSTAGGGPAIRPRSRNTCGRGSRNAARGRAGAGPPIRSWRSFRDRRSTSRAFEERLTRWVSSTGKPCAEEIRRILRRYADLAGPARETSPKLERDDLDPDALFGPDELDELQGLADAVGVPLDNMIAHQVLQFPDSGAGCVHFAVAAGRDLGAGLIHAANEDLPLSLSLRDCLSRVVQARYPVRRHRPPHVFRGRNRRRAQWDQRLWSGGY